MSEVGIVLLYNCTVLVCGRDARQDRSMMDRIDYGETPK